MLAFARMHAPMQRYTFQDTLIEHMVQANNGEAAATAECIKHFPPLTDLLTSTSHLELHPRSTVITLETLTQAHFVLLSSPVCLPAL